MRNAITNRSKDYEMPAHSGNEFRHFLSHLRSIFDMPEELEMHGNEPKIEFSESKDAVNVLAEVPGMNEEDLDVEISSDGYLSISGEKKSRVEHEKGDNYFPKFPTACSNGRSLCRGIWIMPRRKATMKTGF